ncbi:unnamed protein product [Chondrus crispus]|uniref:Uncharacterized protein n=1 Tax=Chondrus crispus TaxID=2769 RepID=R7Q7M0_CHOCR|nr:unnamed protein product [Chondrus crispus]CDF33386.1 unnamed protein product [Chondrus crispus]|eukprot:XP_005713189.1 unnamed protein product [Chondrus crispus]
MPRFAAVCFALLKEVIWRAMSGSYVLIYVFKKSKGLTLCLVVEGFPSLYCNLEMVFVKSQREGWATVRTGRPTYTGNIASESIKSEQNSQKSQ